MIKIKDFQQGAKRPGQWDELHALIDMCFENDDSFSLMFSEETVEDVKAEIERYCASKGIQVDQVYIEDDQRLYVERVYPEETEQPVKNGKHEPRYKQRFKHIVNDLADNLPLDTKHPVFVANDEPARLAMALIKWANYHADKPFVFEASRTKGGCLVRKVSK